MRTVAAFLMTATLVVVAGCTPKPPITMGPAVMTVAGIQVGVAFRPALGTALPTWTYEIDDKSATGRFDRVAINTSVPCQSVSPSPGAGTTLVPATGPSSSWVVLFAPSITSAKITLSCDAAAGGTAMVDVISSPGGAVIASKASFKVLGPR